jgi:hypothetical protein
MSSVSSRYLKNLWNSYNLVLDRHDAEVDNLHSGPHHPIGLQRRHVDVLEFALHSALPTAFGNGHKSKETRKTCPTSATPSSPHSLEWTMAYQMERTRTDQMLHASRLGATSPSC